MINECTSSIISLSIFGISILFTSVTIGNSFKPIKIRKENHIVYEFMRYVLFSEILFSTSRYLCFLRDEKEVNLTDNIVNPIQISFSLLCNIWTLVSVLFHTIFIYDSISSPKQLFKTDDSYKRFCRLFTFITAVIVTLIFLLLTYFVVDHQEEKDDCNMVYCKLHYPLDYCAYGLYFLIILIILSIVIHSYHTLRKLMQQKEEKDKTKAEYRTRDSIDKYEELKKSTKRIWAFPIVNLVYWMCRLSLQILSENSQTKFTILSFIFLIISSLRGIIYSAVFIFVHKDLSSEINKMISHNPFTKAHLEERFVLTRDNISYRIG